jgi:chromosome segregation ATPase
MITHNQRVWDFVKTLLGITMENRGVLKIVSVNLETVIK